jgi:Dihydroorotate dehydrogenase
MNLCGIPLAHPIINASGTFDAIAARCAFGDAVLRRFPFAAFVSKTVTVEPRQGNPPPRLWELPGGMINSIGLPNKGLEGYLAHDLPELAQLPVPLIVNVMGFTREHVATLVEAFGDRDEVSGLELNVSCPNVKTGMIMGADPASTRTAPASRGWAAAAAACPAPRSARSRSRRSRRSALASRSRSWGWAGCRADVRPTTCCMRAQMWWRSGPSRSATRSPARGLPSS